MIDVGHCLDSFCCFYILNIVLLVPFVKCFLDFIYFYFGTCQRIERCLRKRHDACDICTVKRTCSGKLACMC